MKPSEKWKRNYLAKYGKWAVVTGASSGIGKEIAQNLAAIGFKLILHGRNIKRLEEIANGLFLKFNTDVRIISADLSHEDGIKTLISAIDDETDIGLFVASAGFGSSGAFIDSSLENEISMLRVNIEALTALTHYFTRRFVRQQRGGVILMSSIVAFQGVPYAANYSATKTYVQSLAEALHSELKSYHVDVLAAAPGPVHSSFAQYANMKMKLALAPAQIAFPILKALGNRSTVFPGLLTKFLVYPLLLAPRRMKITIMKKIMRNMAAHQLS
ncbi:MAG TPA: SDR family NAD(P)-dependent oxidoreductase [Puia sp.]|nr:SDR family NAD(P)-dependent oxidoreductase [Puia sp.]